MKTSTVPTQFPGPAPATPSATFNVPAAAPSAPNSAGSACPGINLDPQMMNTEADIDKLRK